MDGVGQLPVFDHIPDRVYEVTEVPESIAQARSRIEVLKSEVTVLQAQLSNGVRDVIRNPKLKQMFEGDVKEFYDWRSQKTEEFKLKQFQIFLYKEWIKENKAGVLRVTASRSEEEQLVSRARNIAVFESINPTPKQFAKLRNEIKWIRCSVGELAAELEKVLEGKEPDRNEIAHLKERLLDLDNQAKRISDIWEVHENGERSG